MNAVLQQRIQNVVFVFFVLLSSSKAFAIVRASVGFSTVTSGRQIPALGLGLDFAGVSVSGMFSGMRTKAYYSSGYMINVMRTADWGDFWFGRLEVGFGGGYYHGEKGTYTLVDDNGKLSGLEKDEDNVLGPAFRVAFQPFAHVHISLEYLMGIGISIISNAWEDVGMGAIGVDI